MSTATIYVQASREAIRRTLISLPQRARAGGFVCDIMMANCGEALLDRIQEAFAEKSKGGIDQAGEKWAPLSPVTIVKRLAKQERRNQPPQDYRPSQALNDSQRDRWWEVYRQQLARFRGNKANAAKVAWTVLKSEGAQTLFDKYSTQKVDILRDTNELMESLTPNSNSPSAIFRVSPGEVELGTRRQGALEHHEGDPSRNLPQRRLWPEVNRFPDSWWQDILLEAQEGIVELVLQVVREVG